MIKPEELITLEDGYVYFNPCHGYTGGVFASHHLRQIADTLDKLNKSWDDQINQYFEDDKNKEQFKILEDIYW